MRNQEGKMNYWDTTMTPLGALFIAVNDKGLYHLDFGRGQDTILASLDSGVVKHPLPDFIAQIDQYFSGQRQSFDLPLDLSGTTEFRRQVLETIQDIPFGSVMTYGEVAAAVGKPKGARAIGQAMRHNPIPLIVPCHRVVAADSLGGYGGEWDSAKKRWLLTFEGYLSD